MPIYDGLVSLDTGTFELGPADGFLHVKTYREGMAAKAGHDLVIEVSDWSARVRLDPEPARSTIELEADPRSLHVLEGVGGVKPLTDSDRADIRRSIDEKVLRGRPIRFRADEVRREADGGLTVAGQLSIGDATKPLAASLHASPDGQVTGTIAVTQSEWGIKPYRGLMGALKVRDEVEVVVDVRLRRA